MFFQIFNFKIKKKKKRNRKIVFSKYKNMQKNRYLSSFSMYSFTSQIFTILYCKNTKKVKSVIDALVTTSPQKK